MYQSNTPKMAKLLLGLTVSLILGGVGRAWCQEAKHKMSEASPNRVVLQLPSGYNLGSELALDYNSNCGVRLGKEWSLTGLPAITRDPVMDNQSNDANHYLFNGEKLVLGDEKYYYNESEKSQLFEARDLSSAASYWIMTGKNGVKMYFGYLSGRVEEVEPKGKVKLWALSKVEDNSGNSTSIEYKYNHINGDYYPTLIVYSNQTFHSKGTVEFVYQSRSLRKTQDSNSALADQDRQIEKILINENGNLMRVYRWYYKKDRKSNVSRVVGVKKFEYRELEVQGAFATEPGESGLNPGEWHEKNKTDCLTSSGKWVWRNKE